MRSKLKIEAIKLRKTGKSYKEIANILNISSKGTLSYWLYKVPLDKKARLLIQRKKEKGLAKAQLAAKDKNLKLREEILDKIYKDAHLVEKNIKNSIYNMKLALAFLYLGEGSKWKSHRGLMLGSSEPDIINLYVKLLNICYGIRSDQLKCRISHRADQNLKSLERFWSKITGVPLKNFYKSKPDPRTIGKPTKNKGYKGVCVLSCAGTQIQLELEAIPKAILKGL